MKRVHESELTRTALAKGAVLSIGAQRVNSSGQRLALARPAPTPAPAPVLTAPPPPPPPAAMALDTQGLERAAAAGAHGNQSLLMAIAALVQEVKAQRDAQAAPIKQWKFHVERDRYNNLDITATAIR